MITQKRILIFTLLLVVGIIIIESIYLLSPAKKSNLIGRSNVPADSLRREETMPADLDSRVQRGTITQDGKRFIRETAKVNMVDTPGMKYQVALYSGASAVIMLSEGTMIADAWFGFDKANKLTAIQYEKISKSELSRVKAGDTVRVTYAENTDISQPISVTEFVLMQ